ncbi:MAG TPA: hypothetical protein PK191_04800 [Niabella sp.]|nr:hypothetical protein [Niabella sp.]HOZ95880.1 hypothetical protein [Niabella sp.]HQW15792.1 hypothetical protein [Niabella sp.]HQX20932.1 hypothetical protein [Niabella sp.]HQX41424.1 hypothetical protein [Niabella sp.]
MKDYKIDIITQIELHNVDGIRQCFEKGVHPNDLFNGLPLMDELISEYLRSPRFKDCVKVFVDYGLHFEDSALLAVLLNDAAQLESLLINDANLVNNKYFLRCAYTPLLNVSMLHICAEFNHLESAEVLIKFGADVNAMAGCDEFGFGGQTPIFHTVNQNNNQSADLLQLLLQNGANTNLTVKGIVWGKTYPWETFIPAVNPINYAMMGLLPQMYRNANDIVTTISVLMKHQYGMDYSLPNIPNRYLSQK